MTKSAPKSLSTVYWGLQLPIEFSLPKKIIRYIAKATFNESCKSYFAKFKILPFPCLYVYHILLFMKHNFQTLIGDVYKTKHNNLQILVHKTNLYKHNIYYMGTIFSIRYPKNLKPN